MMSESTRKTRSASLNAVPSRSAKVQPLRFSGDDAALVAALKQKHPGAMEALYDRYGLLVQRVLLRVMGVDPTLPDMIQEVFVEAFSNVRSIKDGSRLQAWMTSIAVFTARGRIRRRSRRRAFWVVDGEDAPEIPTAGCDPEEREALLLTYQILDTLPADERIAFSLRFIEGMELEETAQACRVSLSTVKRRLGRAQKRFAAIAGRHAVLRSWIAEGERWNTR